jgi:hypothetical protein
MAEMTDNLHQLLVYEHTTPSLVRKENDLEQACVTFQMYFLPL